MHILAMMEHSNVLKGSYSCVHNFIVLRHQIDEYHFHALMNIVLLVLLVNVQLIIYSV